MRSDPDEADLGPLFEGQVLEGRYYLKKRLGEGGFAAVFHAHHCFLGRLVREVAVKITKTAHLTAETLADKFGEAIVSAQIYDRVEGSEAVKYLVPVYDMGILEEHDGRGFIVMGLVRGAGSSGEDCRPAKTLEETIANWAGAQMAPGMAFDYMKRASAAVAALHDQRVIHRDLKPDNILLSETGEIRLVDLGLAAPLNESGYVAGEAGTREYMAPETALEERSTCASDVYSLGIILYRMLTGRSPFGALRPPESDGDPHRLQKEKANARILPPSAYNRAVEPWQDDLVRECLSASVPIRPPSARQLHERIVAGAGGAEPGRPQEPWTEWLQTARNWAAEAAGLETIVSRWRDKPGVRRTPEWFDLTTKLAVCRIALGRKRSEYEGSLREAESLFVSGMVMLSYAERAAWYGGIAEALERTGGAPLLLSELREKEREARRKSTL
jgi:serine/threonine-protein kinase